MWLRVRAERAHRTDLAEVQAALAKARSERAAQLWLTAHWVLMQQVALYESTAETEPEIARRALRDIGDGIGMYVRKTEHRVVELSSGETDHASRGIAGCGEATGVKYRLPHRWRGDEQLDK